MKKTKLLAFILTCAIFLSTLIVPIAAESDAVDTTPTMIYNAKSITVDGQKGAGEYSDTPHMVLNKVVGNDISSSTETVAYSPNLYLSTEGKNLYVFYEIAQDIINDDKNSRLYFSFETGNTTNGWQSNGKEGYSGELIIYIGKGDTTVHGIFQYYYKKDTAVSEETLKNVACKIGTSTMSVDNDTINTYTVELKIPLKEDVQETLTEGGTTLKFGALQRYNIKAGTGVNWALTGETSYKWNKCSHSNLLAILPRPIIIAGFQSRKTPEATDSVDVRFVSVMKADAEKLANMQAGYDFTYYPNGDATGTEATVNCTKVYTSLSADGGTLNATDYGGNYFFCYTISGLSYGSSYTFDVTCWTKEDGTTTESIKIVHVTITVSEAGEVSFTLLTQQNEELINLNGYQIVIPQNASQTVAGLAAYELKAYLQTVGYTLEVLEEDDAASVNQKSILVGKTAYTVSNLPPNHQYAIYLDDNGRLQIAASSSYGYQKALDDIKEWGGFPVQVNQTGDAAQAFSGSAANMEKSDGSLRIMSYNIYGYEDTNGSKGGPVALRQELQLEIFQFYDPDVIGFQEYVAKSHSSMTAKLAALGYAEVPITPSASDDSVNDTPIFYNTATVSLVEGAYGYFLYTGDGCNNSNTKSLSWAVFQQKGENGKRFAVVNTHLMYNEDGIDHTAQRQTNVVQLLAKIQAIQAKYPNVPIILGGDLNCTYQSEPFTDIQTGGFTWMRDAEGINTDAYGKKVYATFSYETNTYTSCPSPSATGYGIDHVFMSGDLTASNYLTVTDRNACLASDHCPKFADIVLE